MMSVGDVYELSIPPALAFGSKGRRASAGKPSIPAGAYVTVSLAALCFCCWCIFFFLTFASVCVQPTTGFDCSVLTWPAFISTPALLSCALFL